MIFMILGLFLFPNTALNTKIWPENWCHVIFCLAPSLPLVIFGDTVPYPSPSPLAIVSSIIWMGPYVYVGRIFGNKMVNFSRLFFRFELENETSFTTKKGRSVDNSIARAFTAAIRRAKRFIYIENQYFMGSAYGWLDDQVAISSTLYAQLFCTKVLCPAFI